ncbi:hypothetical protein MAPG_05223 [Magnaporthiopsis poae ATCC 64411]|uniref:Uncharacterized protein n=1 Tax=Magnaporthiopsis poae (strain ATCC 64411 / 73-15) TaxID=644358 RepID=A0A0C4DYU4_MAGP6|nr:hypothetical protein MAPG_05223 [Magnaporthiopsis poae ATCC 64411]
MAPRFVARRQAFDAWATGGPEIEALPTFATLFYLGEPGIKLRLLLVPAGQDLVAWRGLLFSGLWKGRERTERPGRGLARFGINPGAREPRKQEVEGWAFGEDREA